MSDFSPRDKILLIALRKGNHFKANPGQVSDLMAGEPVQEANAAARRLLAAEMVKKVERMGEGFWLRITDKGMAAADIAIEETRSPTIQERLHALPVGKGVWDIIKIGLAFVLGILANKYLGK